MATPTGPKPTIINAKVAADPLGEDKPWSTPLPQGISPGEAKGTHAVNPYGVANSHQRDDIRGLD